MSESREDAALAMRFAAGETDAFHEVVEKFEPRITGLVHRLLAWPDEVDDVVQEVFLAALKKRKSFRGECQLSTWLCGIAINECRRHRAVRVISPAELPEAASP